VTTTLDILKRLRALPMTQTQIAKRIGCSQARMCKWEAGKVPAGADDALKLQALLAEMTAAAASGSASTPSEPTTNV
jgi:transcriptional regulator with XRE-family HTH domain